MSLYTKNRNSRLRELIAREAREAEAAQRWALYKNRRSNANLERLLTSSRKSSRTPTINGLEELSGLEELLSSRRSPRTQSINGLEELLSSSRKSPITQSMNGLDFLSNLNEGNSEYSERNFLLRGNSPREMYTNPRYSQRRTNYNENKGQRNIVEKAKARELGRIRLEKTRASIQNIRRRLSQINEQRNNLLEKGEKIKMEIKLARQNKSKANAKISTLEQQLAQVFENAKRLRANSGYNTYKGVLRSMRENPFDPKTPIREMPSLNQIQQMQQMQQVQRMQGMQGMQGMQQMQKPRQKRGLITRGLNYLRGKKRN